jgi:5'-3' exonuclease
MDAELLLVDARHLLWRAASVFFDLHIENKDGTTSATGGIYGFLRIAMSTRFRFGGKVIACWDLPEGPTERRKLYDQYKNRPSKPKTDKPHAPTRYAPDGITGEYNAADRARPQTVEREVMIEQMREQEIVLKRLLSMLGMLQASSRGWEADDVIATLATRHHSHTIGILSGDRDLIQLVTATTQLIRPLPKGLFDVMDPDKVRTDMGITPAQVLDLKALAGDPGDNIPGAKGIGPVTATKLIQEHKTWRQALIWAQTTNSTQTAVAKKLIASEAEIEMSAQLAMLNRKAPLDFIEPAKDAKRVLFEMARLKFTSLLQDGRREQLMALGD